MFSRPIQALCQVPPNTYQELIEPTASWAGAAAAWPTFWVEMAGAWARGSAASGGEATASAAQVVMASAAQVVMASAETAGSHACCPLLHVPCCSRAPGQSLSGGGWEARGEGKADEGGGAAWVQGGASGGGAG